MKKLILIFLFVLSACTPLQPKVIERRVEVPVTCVEYIPEKPIELIKETKLTDSLSAKVKALLAELDLRKAYELKLEGIVEGCK